MKEFQEVFDAVLSRAHARGAMRVWSVLITVLGDAIVPRGGVVGLASIQPVLSRLQIEPNAVRTAMSRLARDGWVKRERIGRQSFYALASEGYDLFDQASKRIYATEHVSWDGTFEFVMMTDESPAMRKANQRKMGELGFGTLMADVYVRPKLHNLHAPSLDSDRLRLEVQSFAPLSVPELVGRCWPVDDLSKGYRTLMLEFEPVLLALAHNRQLEPVDAMACRALLIHEWRKVILRDVNLPTIHMPHGRDVEAARRLVSELYQTLLPLSEGFLDHCMATQSDRLPAPDQGFRERFHR